MVWIDAKATCLCPEYIHHDVKFGGVSEMEPGYLLENVKICGIHVIHLLYNVDFLTRPRFKIP